MKSKPNYERELEGPHSYKYFNTLSKLCQNRYTGLLRAQLLFLLTISLISIIPGNIYGIENYLQGFNIILMILVFILMILQYSKNYMEGWQKGRFLAESILSNCWLVIFRCGSYNQKNYNECLAKFHDRIKEMKKEINIKDYFYMLPQEMFVNDNPVWMREKYETTSEDKKTFYIQYRINDQIDWYSKKAKFNTDNSKNYFLYGLISLGLGIVLSVFVLLKLVPALTYLGLFTTIAACLFSWKQTKRFDELKTTYSVAADELSDFKRALINKTSEDDIKETVFDTEKSISREHKLWFSKVLD